jgi:hypothetical protein
MPTLGPRRNIEPGRVSLSAFVTVATNLTKPMREPQRSTDWSVILESS